MLYLGTKGFDQVYSKHVWLLRQAKEREQIKKSKKGISGHGGSDDECESDGDDD